MDLRLLGDQRRVALLAAPVFHVEPQLLLLDVGLCGCFFFRWTQARDSGLFTSWAILLQLGFLLTRHVELAPRVMIAQVMGIDHPSVFTTVPAELMATFAGDVIAGQGIGFLTRILAGGAALESHGFQLDLEGSQVFEAFPGLGQCHGSRAAVVRVPHVVTTETPGSRTCTAVDGGVQWHEVRSAFALGTRWKFHGRDPCRSSSK